MDGALLLLVEVVTCTDAASGAVVGEKTLTDKEWAADEDEELEDANAITAVPVDASRYQFSGGSAKHCPMVTGLYPSVLMVDSTKAVTLYTVRG